MARAKSKPKKSPRAMFSLSTSASATTLDPEERLHAWALDLSKAEHGKPRARVAVIREDHLEAYDIERVTGAKLGDTALYATATVLARSVDDDDLVALLAPAPSAPGNPARRVLVVLRSRRGAFSARLHTFSLPLHTATLTEDMLPDLPDWTDRALRVDPAIEDRLADAKVPGADRRVVASAVLAVTPVAGPSAPVTSLVATEAGPNTAQQIDVPWESAVPIFPELNDGGLDELLFARYCDIPAAAPIHFEQRAFAELLSVGWSSDAQALALMRRIDTLADLGVALRELVAAKVPPIARRYGLARIADRGVATKDLANASAAARVLVDEHEAAVRDAGGVVAWLDRTWPAKANAIGDRVITAELALAGGAIAWTFNLGTLTRSPQQIGVAATACEALRDALLDRLDVHPGDPGSRVVEASRALFSSLPSSSGEHRLERWRERLQGRSKEHVSTVLRDLATYYAAWLHSVATIIRAGEARTHAMLDHDMSTWRPERTPTKGVFSRARLVLARHCLLRAIREPNADTAVSILGRARSLADTDDRYASVHNEARARLDRFDAELLRDLTTETRVTPSLGTAAEMLCAGERVGSPQRIALAQRRLRAVARSTPHAWIAEARVVLGRPSERSDRATIAELARGREPSAIDVDERAARALYGIDPAKTIRDVRAALAAQLEALDWAALVDEVRAEERSATPTGEGLPRPEVPRTFGDGALVVALAALRFRLDRPALGKHAAKRSLEAHARRAAELVASESRIGATWLLAMGGDEGLVAALDRALAGAFADVAAALARAEAALEEGLRASWLEDTNARLRALWPMLPAGDGDLRRDLGALTQRAAEAADASARSAVDGGVTALFERARTRVVEEPEEAESGERLERLDDDGFFEMTIEDSAMDWSRRELDTPEWAIAEGLRQVALYNLARGRRDRKMLRGTRDEGGALWELRHRDGRHPVRVMYVLGEDGPRVVAVLAKQDDAHQVRMIERVRGARRSLP